MRFSFSITTNFAINQVLGQRNRLSRCITVSQDIKCEWPRVSLPGRFLCSRDPLSSLSHHGWFLSYSPRLGLCHRRRQIAESNSLCTRLCVGHRCLWRNDEGHQVTGYEVFKILVTRVVPCPRSPPTPLLLPTPMTAYTLIISRPRHYPRQSLGLETVPCLRSPPPVSLFMFSRGTISIPLG